MIAPDLQVGQKVCHFFHRWTPDGWVAATEIVTVVNPCVEDDPDYAGEVQIHSDVWIGPIFTPRACLAPIDSSSGEPA